MKYYIVDAFTTEVFKGNPAGVCLLESRLEDEVMQQIAAENNLSETAFLLKNGEGYELRWFTPKFEIDLCGHATLASAFVLFHFVEKEKCQLTFYTQSGMLEVSRRGEKLDMYFPKRSMEKIQLTEEVQTNLGIKPKEIYSARDLVVVVDTEEEVKNYRPCYEKLELLSDWLGIVITAKGEQVDFVSRYFCPELKIEDPVTGSTHSNLIPYWAQKLGKINMTAYQLSQRGGILYCELQETGVKISGEAVLYLQGEIKG